MINRYIVRTFIILGVALHSPSALCGFSILAPDPIIHDMMWDGFFAQKLIQKHPDFVRAGGGYPLGVLGGIIEVGVIHNTKFSVEPQINNILGNGVVCLNRYSLFAFSGHYDRYSRKAIHGWALILGEHSRYHSETRIGQIKIPFSLYGAIGSFISPVAPWRSKMAGVENELGLIAGENYLPKSMGVLIGGKKSFGVNTISLQAKPVSFSKSKITPAVILNLDILRTQPGYEVNLGGGYSLQRKSGTVYAGFSKDAFTVSGHREIQRKRGQSYFKNISSRRNEKDRIERAGRIEGSYQVLLPRTRLPATVFVGYGWGRNFLAAEANEGSLMVKVLAHQYVRIKVGAKFGMRQVTKKHSKKQKDGKIKKANRQETVLKCLKFIVGLDIIC